MPRPLISGKSGNLSPNQASRISIPLANGISVIAAATATLYEREGTFQLCVTDLQMDGVGAQQSALEQRKRRLAALGVFDADCI